MPADAEALYKANHRGLFHYVCRVVGHADTAPDLTRDVFVRVSRASFQEVRGDQEILLWRCPSKRPATPRGRDIVPQQKETIDDHRRAHSGIRRGSADDAPPAGARAGGQADVDPSYEVDVAREARHAPCHGAGGNFDLAAR